MRHAPNTNSAIESRKAPATPPVPKPRTPATREAHVIFKTEGHELSGPVKHFARQSATFELYGEALNLRLSEALTDFQINVSGQAVYAGPAVLASIVDNGNRVTCEVNLEKTLWLPEADVLASLRAPNGPQKEFEKFTREWQKLYAIAPEFKVAVADMQTFLHDQQLWLSQVETSLQAVPSQERARLEHDFLSQVLMQNMQSLGSLFARFEHLASAVEPPARLAHSIYAQRVLHPLVLCSPFMHRTFKKPLGYAGDYEMVRMMTLDPFQGTTLFAKLLNAFFLNTPPVVAHRNRIDTLVRHLEAETLRPPGDIHRVKIFNLGCGPAAEIQRFLANSNRSSITDFTLLDFNDETVAFARQTLDRIKSQHNRGTGIEVLKKSVTQLIKSTAPFKPGSFDLVYCAGLFDYLSDNVSTMLLEIFYKLTKPGGLVLVSNVEASNPSRGWMECMVDWHLVYRNATDMHQLVPATIPQDAVRVFSEISSVNIFAQIRKPDDA